MTILIQLLRHTYLRTIRSIFGSMAALELLYKIFLALYLTGFLVLSAYFGDTFIAKKYPSEELGKLMTMWMVYYFVCELIVRFFFQSSKHQDDRPYHVLHISTKSLHVFQLWKSFFNFFNPIGIIFITIFSFKQMSTSNETDFWFVWWIIFGSLILVNHLLTIMFRKFMTVTPVIVLSLISTLVLLIYLDIQGHINVTHSLYEFVLLCSSSPVLLLGPVILVTVLLMSVYVLIRDDKYLEYTNENKIFQVRSFALFEYFGLAGRLVLIELKMIVRNKRPSSMMVMQPILLVFIGFSLFHDKESTMEQGLKNFDFIMTVILTGLFAFSHFQFVVSWDSTYWDALISRHISTYDYLKSKYIIFTSLCLINFVIFWPFTFGHLDLVLVSLGAFIFHIGVSSFIFLSLAMFNRTKLNLDKSQWMNYQGFSWVQYSVVLVLLVILGIIYAIFKFLAITQYAYCALCLLGLLGMIFLSPILKKIAFWYDQQKTDMATAFRK
ncbi:MAG: DUF5687 family protein [Saprospiraceae bacterium]